MLIQARNCQTLADLAAEADGSQTKVKDQDIWGDGRDPLFILLKSDKPWLSPEIWKFCFGYDNFGGLAAQTQDFLKFACQDPQDP
jgi:hypothetical protein